MSRSRLFGAAMGGVLLASSAIAAPHGHGHHAHDHRNYDARVSLQKAVAAQPSALQQRAVDSLRASVQDLNVEFSQHTGALAKLSSHTGYLTEARDLRATPLENGLAYVQDNLSAFGLMASDLQNYEVTDEVYSQVSGATRIYLRQTLQGLPVYNAQLHININREGRIISVNNAFLPALSSRRAAIAPKLNAAAAVLAASDQAGLGIKDVPRTLSTLAQSVERTSLIDNRGLAFNEVKAQLMWLPVGSDVRLVWNFQIETLDSQHFYDFTVDAESGKVWTRFDWVADDSFRVYETPVESPNHVSPLPPSDARTLVVNPEDATASPNDWFSGNGIMDGNNVHACADANANNGCDSGQPTCSGGVCDFPINLNAAPSASLDAAITNLFYWNNIIHDVQYQYGFDEAGGNFQENNFGRGGSGSDSVNADAQDGSGNCNANFGTPPDGSNPRMQMFTCNRANPSRDGDYDNGVIVHEYGHGISTRQVGGPSNSGCLSNAQQAGEGWSDLLALIYTHEPGDAGTDKRGIGTYLFGESANGDGIRDLPYSTSSSINNWTYESIIGAVRPHGVGSRWAQVGWEVYWALTDKYGFEADLANFNINDANEAGNKRALFYINEGLKNTRCSPHFVDNRDGIIQAATDNFGGADVCDIWQAFADFGLGTNAQPGSRNATSPTNGFSVPASCSGGGGGGGGGGTCDGTNCIDWDSTGTVSYAGQDNSSSVTVSNGGDTITLNANTWRRTTQTFTVTANTVIEFEFSSTSQGEIHGIGFDEDNAISSDRVFRLYGTQNWGIADFANYSGGTVSYSIPVGQFYTGSNMFLVLVNDKDAGALTNNSTFTNVRVFESGGSGGGSCVVDDDFEGGAAGWSNAGGSTCTTGAYVLGNPSSQASGGVTTQPSGSASGTTSVFTATNTSAGNADVDGGNCILTSPAWNVPSGSTLSFNYFHGQRDGGDDSGDFFNVQYRVNGGSWTSVVSNGDSVSNASWTAASTPVPAGSIELRVQCSDGSGPGDIIECGLDDVRICN
ncbi:MAG: extracellular metalloproteinase [Acidobacteriota bacterium]